MESPVVRHAVDTITIGDRLIGSGQPVYIVAELSAKHLQSLERARLIVQAAATAGADAIKLQTYTPDTITLDLDGEDFRVGGNTPWEGERLYDIYEQAQTPWSWHAELFELAASLGLDCFSSPFDASAVEFLERLDPPAYKIASFELVDSALVERCARTGRPLVMSTGMATPDEIATALAAAAKGRAASSNPNAGVALLKCTSAYPSPVDALHLRGLRTLAENFGVPVGLSDHTLDDSIVVAAIALGACIVERHLTLARSDGGLDAAFSLEPAEFLAMTRAIRKTEAALGSERIGPTPEEDATRRFRRSLFVVLDLAAGEVVRAEHLRSVRPDSGLAPEHLGTVLGQRAACNVAAGTPLRWDHLEPE
jgi:pseudaminic acid synthase